MEKNIPTERQQARFAEDERLRTRQSQLSQWVKSFAAVSDSLGYNENINHIEENTAFDLLRQFPEEFLECSKEREEIWKRLVSHAYYFLGKHRPSRTDAVRHLHQFLSVMGTVLKGKKDEVLRHQFAFRILLVFAAENWYHICHESSARALPRDRSEMSGIGLLKETDVSGKIHTWTHEKPVFWNDEEDGLHDMDMAEEMLMQLPSSFCDNPTHFIENSAENIDRCSHTFAKEVQSLFCRPYDSSRVRQFENHVFKRVDILKVHHGTEEIDKAEEAKEAVEAIGDPRFRVQEFVGSVYDRGNIYLLSKYVPASMNLQDHGGYKKELSILRRALENIHMDLEPRNVLVQFHDPKKKRRQAKSFTVVDFETKPTGQ